MGGKVVWGWNPDDVEKLKEVYENKSQAEVMSVFPGRPWKNIWTKAHSLGLVRTNVYRNGREVKPVMDLRKIDIEEKAYVLGFIAADGALCQRLGNRTPSLSIKLSKTDYDHLCKLRDLISPESNIRYNKNDDMFLFDVADISLSNYLQLHGICVRKTYNPKVPITVPRKLIKHWIRGYFDGDGCITFGKKVDYPDCFIGGYTLENGSNPIIEFINKEFRLVYSHNCNVTFNQKGLTTIHYGNKTAVVFLNWIYGGSTIYMDRKFALAKSYFIDDLVSYIKSLEERPLRLPINRWDEEEISIIREFGRKLPVKDLTAKLPDKNVNQIYYKVRSMERQGKLL